MSDFENPYQSPEASVEPAASQDSGVQMTVNMLKYLSEASPWLRFIGILGFIGAGFTVFIGIISSLGTAAAGSFLGEFSGMVGMLFLIYIPIGIIMFFPAYFTYKFGQKIKNYRFTNSIEDLEEALKNNKSYWKFTGILYIIFISIIPVFIFGSIVFGIIAAFGAF